MTEGTGWKWKRPGIAILLLAIWFVLAALPILFGVSLKAPEFVMGILDIAIAICLLFSI